MSIALESNSNRIEGSGFIRGMSCITTMFESPESGRPMDGILHRDRRFPVGNLAEERGEEELDDSCSSSSIGRDSDLSGRSSDDEGSGETEVQSSYKGPLNTMDALEDVLPIRRGISNFYRGKSKSFTSLADASSSSSIKDITKPENPYSKKRKNLLACSNNIWDNKSRNFPLRSNGGGISKRPTNASRSTLALAVAMSSSESNNTTTSSDNSTNSSTSPSPPRLLPPLHPRVKTSVDNANSSSPRQSFSPWRSFSLTDLQSIPANKKDNLKNNLH